MRTRRSSKSSILVVVMIGAGSLAAAVAGALLLPSLMSAGSEHPSAMGARAAAGLCQNLEIDGTGQLRDKGLVSCEKVVGQGRRIDLVRDSFSKR